MRMSVFCIILIIYSHQSIAADLRFESDVSIKSIDKNQFEKIPAGQVFSAEKNNSYYIVGSKNIPILLISSQAQDSQFNITNQDFSNVFNEKTNQLLEQKTNSIVNNVRKAEALLLRKDFTQALAIVNKLKEEHKNISSILFLSGTINSLLNNKKVAIEDLEEGLKIDADDVAALSMLKKLKGAQ